MRAIAYMQVKMLNWLKKMLNQTLVSYEIGLVYEQLEDHDKSLLHMKNVHRNACHEQM